MGGVNSLEMKTVWPGCGSNTCRSLGFMHRRVYKDMCAWGADAMRTVATTFRCKTYYFQYEVYRKYCIDHTWGIPLDIRQLHYLLNHPAKCQFMPKLRNLCLSCRVSSAFWSSCKSIFTWNHIAGNHFIIQSFLFAHICPILIMVFVTLHLW